MRISTGMLFNQGVYGMLQRQQTLVDLQNQLATGRRVNRPSDDPEAAALIEDFSQAKARNERFQQNVTAAQSFLNVSETQLSAAVRLSQEVIELGVQAGNASLGDRERGMLSVEIEKKYQELLALANSTDGNGVYLYGGNQGGQRPFIETAPGVVQYVGDQGGRSVEVDPSRQVRILDNGDAIFMRIPAGNGLFVTAANAANAGTGVIDTGSVSNLTALTGQNYRVDFSVVAGATQYRVTNTSTGVVTVPNTPFTPNAEIQVAGMAFRISGAPQAGDSFTLAPSGGRSLFDTLHNLVSTLATPNSSVAVQAQNETRRRAALTELQGGLTNLLRHQTSIGARLKELDGVTDVNEGLDTQYQQSIGDLQDLDYAKAISDFTLTQTVLTAAQKSFKDAQQLSLFNYLS